MMGSHEIETGLRAIAEKLLGEKKVDLVLGYEKASTPFRTTPLFLTSPEETERLVWNPFCSANLAVYLPRLFAPATDPRKAADTPQPTVAVVLKGCDARSAVTLIQERQVPRGKLVILGIACPGIVDRRKAEKALGEHEALGAGEDTHGNIHVVADDGGDVILPRKDILAAACLECRFPTPPLYDELFGSSVEARGPEEARGRTAEFESKDAGARWAHLQAELSKCIRCNACRQACPLCYCKECLLDQTRPRWIGAGTDISDVMIYHLIRAVHLAGRCSECGACTRACPVQTDTRLLVRKLNQKVEELYGYRPGEVIDAAFPLAAFAMDDPQDFVTEP
jgi:ferredoxin